LRFWQEIQEMPRRERLSRTDIPVCPALAEATTND
jgi:hypothetical protein